MERITLLHVDRDADFLELVSRTLEREVEDIEILTATEVDEGLGLLEQHDVDCVVSEYALWKSDGLEFLRGVRERFGDLPFILFTSKGSEEIASEAVSAGVTEYLEKKFTSEQYTLLANRVKQAVRKHRAEEEVRRAHTALETAREGISILDSKGRYVYVNDAYADIYGYEPGEMLGRHWELIYPEEEIDLVQNEIDRELESKGYWRGETTGLRKDGSTFPEDHSVSVTDDGDVVCVVRDLTDIKRLESEIEERERMFSTLLSNLPGMAYRCLNDPDWPMEFVSEGCERLTGYSPRELEEDEVVWGEDVLHPDDYERAWEVVQEALENREPFKITYRITTKEGEEKWVWEQGSGVYSDGELEAIEGFITDITERKRMESEIERTSSHLEAVIEASPVPIVSLDPEGRVETWNDAAEEVFGWSKEDVQGEPVPIVPEDSRDQFEGLLERVVDGESLSGVELRRKRKDGSLVDIRLSTAPVQGEDGEVTGVMALLEDVTERKRDEQQLQVLNRVLRHNLRNDLNIVLGYSELVMEEASDPDVKREAREIMRTAESLSSLSEKAQHTEKTLRRSSEYEVDLGEVLERLREEYLVDYPDADIDLEVMNGAKVSRQIEVAVEEVLENALEHNDGDPEVVVRSATENGDVVIQVTDNGPGIPGNERMVLERGEETNLAHGSGFGLWLVNWVVTRLGGELTFSENDPRGSVVTIRVPA